MERRHELEAMTRDELLALARDAGIDGAEWQSREELVASLSRTPAAGRVSGIFDRAKALLDRARELGKSFRAASRPPDPPTPAADPPDAPKSAPAGDEDTGPPPASTGARFETLTMAEVHASQGLVAEARRIAQAVLAREPDNAEAKALLARLAEPSTAVEPLEAAWGEDTVDLLLVRPDLLYCAWEITGEGRALTSGRLGEEGRLTLRHFTATGAGGVHEDEEVGEAETVAMGGSVGEVFLPAVPDARHRVAIGLLGGGGRFVPVAHSACVTTPRAEPSGDRRVDWVEVRMAPGGDTAQRPLPRRVSVPERRP